MQRAQQGTGPAVGCYRNLLQLEFSFKEFWLQPASKHPVTLADKIQIQVLSVCAAGCLSLSKNPGGPSILTSSDLFVVTWAPEGILITYTAPNTQKPSFFLILYFHLINKKKSKNSDFLRIIKQCLKRKSFFPHQAGFSPADPVNTAGKFSSMPLTYFHLAPVWCIRSDSPAVTGHLHHCRHDNSERQSMIPYPGHPFQCSLSVQSHWE